VSGSVASSGCATTSEPAWPASVHPSTSSSSGSEGLSIDAALTEWADLADVDELTRLVQVLALHHAATDLGPLISAEARSIRAEAHRRLIARMEQRAQLVWVPVTVAALLPGAIFLAVPFADAMRLVTG